MKLTDAIKAQQDQDALEAEAKRQQKEQEKQRQNELAQEALAAFLQQFSAQIDVGDLATVKAAPLFNPDGFFSVEWKFEGGKVELLRPILLSGAISTNAPMAKNLYRAVQFAKDQRGRDPSIETDDFVRAAMFAMNL